MVFQERCRGSGGEWGVLWGRGHSGEPWSCLQDLRCRRDLKSWATYILLIPLQRWAEWHLKQMRWGTTSAGCITSESSIWRSSRKQINASLTKSKPGELNLAVFCLHVFILFTGGALTSPHWKSDTEYYCVTKPPKTKTLLICRNTEIHFGKDQNLLKDIMTERLENITACINHLGKNPSIRFKLKFA